MIKAIIFDCFGVLTADTWKEFVAQLTHAQAEQVSGMNHAYDAGQITKQTFVQQVQAATGHPPRYVEDLVDNEAYKNVELLSYIKTLRPKYKIGLLSNVASNWIRETFLTPEESALFDAMTLSFEVGMTKPDKRMFELAAQSLGIAPSEAVLIDDVEAYCEAAKGIGMQAVVYQNFPHLKRELERLLTLQN